MEQMFCPECGTKREGTLFCGECGYKFEEQPNVENTTSEEIQQASVEDNGNTNNEQTENNNLPSTKTCPNCGNVVSQDSDFCNKCGTNLSEKLYCSKCGFEYNWDDVFCPKCGNKLQNHSIETKEKNVQSQPVAKQEIYKEEHAKSFIELLASFLVSLVKAIFSIIESIVSFLLSILASTIGVIIAIVAICYFILLAIQHS